jgi:hypothetical protein
MTKMTINQAIKILGLKSPFSMAELKTAYRKLCLLTHPDCGGKSENFIAVDSAYDLLKTYTNDFKDINDEYWEKYWNKRIKNLEKEFAKSWKQTFEIAKSEKNGMWFSTCIERFARAYMRPRVEWFQGVLFQDATTEAKNLYRELLLEIAPNQRLREQWAIKYYRLEFGYETPYTFYLPPAKELLNAST